ncbi:DUF6582 domain-containing protein [Streptomyces sp. NPDC007148]|uniref:DUF6582 domain-containing protein n=1 Tax=Streptomyces sp. NPDC007148 TaxID=3364775 RepID=UPI0036A5535F
MADRIGTITGIALVPGVSRNGRLYTAEAIGRAVQRAKARIEEDGAPLTMLTHHAADDDSTQIVGQLTSVTQLEDGRAAFTADLADTDEAHKIASLVDTRKGRPFLKGVSIRGAWVGKVRNERGPDGAQVQTADDLELDGLDFTRKPGVLGAQVDSFTPTAAGAPAETAPEGRVLITESVQEALVTTTVTEAEAKDGDASKPYGDVAYADPGYQSDKKKRYPLDTKAHAKSAWSYISQADNARLYTSAQLKRVKQRIVKALKSFGVQVAAQEGWLIEPASQVTEALAECWGMDSADAGNLYVSLTNGPTTVTVSSYSLDPHDLDAVGRAAMAGAVQTLVNIDPDLDADVDVPGEPGDDTPTATAAGAPCPCGCGCAIPETPGACPCQCSGGQCAHCMGEDDDGDGDDAMESLAYVRAGEPLTAAQQRLLEESGLLKPGVVVTAGLVNQAIDARRALTETSAPEPPAADIPTEEKEGPAMAESTTPAAETAAVPAAGGVHLTDEQFEKLLSRLGPAPVAPATPTESAPAEPVAETQAAAPAAAAEVTETEDQRIQRLIAEGVAAALPKAIQEHVETTGGPSRKGLVEPVTETSATGPTASGLPEGAPAKPLHEYTQEEWRQHIAPVVTGAVFNGRGPAE